MSDYNEEEYDDDDEIVKKIMHVVRRAPHGTIYTYEGLEMVLIMAAYDQDITMVFIDDGVYSLLDKQETEGVGFKGYAKTFKALSGYDVEKLYVDRESMEERGLKVENLVVPVEVMSSAEIGKLMREQEVLIHH
jgi:tRNA 2-thiouridine synthesizing protein C